MEVGGTAASGGVASGTAVLLVDGKLYGSAAGTYVLVADITAPQHVNLLAGAEAIVLERGSQSSHAAIVARELEIPCIIQATLATARIVPGAEVMVDADAGVIRWSVRGDQCIICMKPREFDMWGTREVRIFPDGYPVRAGHALIAPTRHVERPADLTAEEWAAFKDAVTEFARITQGRYGTSDCNIGVNVGPNAGQTVAHLHVHAIPRPDSDRDSARGGVRRVVADPLYEY